MNLCKITINGSSNNFYVKPEDFMSKNYGSIFHHSVVFNTNILSVVYSRKDKYPLKRPKMRIEISRFKDSSLNFAIFGKYFHHSDLYLNQRYYLLEVDRKNKIKARNKVRNDEQCR